MANSKKYIHDLSVTSDQLASQDKVIIEKADGSGTKIMSYSDLIASVTSTILKNNGTTTSSGYALDARYGKTLTDILSSGKITMVDGKTSDKDLNTIYTNQADSSCVVVNGQQEGNQATAAGIIHYVLSFRRASTYGVQVEFYNNNKIFARVLNNGTWSEWKVLGDGAINYTTFQATGFVTGTGTAANIGIEKCGHVAVIRFNGSINSLAAGETTFTGKIPEGYRPQYDVIFWTFCTTSMSGTGTRVIQITVNTDGDFILYNYGTAISDTLYVYRFRETYLIP